MSSYLERPYSAFCAVRDSSRERDPSTSPSCVWPERPQPQASFSHRGQLLITRRTPHPRHQANTPRGSSGRIWTRLEYGLQHSPVSSQLAHLFPMEDTAPVQPQRPDWEDVAIVRVRDHAVPVEHSTDVLLWPVSTFQLHPHQVSCSFVQRHWILLVLPGCQECKHRPPSVDDLRAFCRHEHGAWECACAALPTGVRTHRRDEKCARVSISARGCLPALESVQLRGGVLLTCAQDTAPRWYSTHVPD